VELLTFGDGYISLPLVKKAAGLPNGILITSKKVCIKAQAHLHARLQRCSGMQTFSRDFLESRLQMNQNQLCGFVNLDESQGTFPWEFTHAFFLYGQGNVLRDDFVRDRNALA